MIFRRIAIPALVIIAAGLSACAPPPAGEFDFGEPTHGPRPEPMLAMTCADIDVDRPLELAFGVIPEPLDPMLMEYASTSTIPQTASIRAAGGLVCGWRRTDTPLYIGVTLQVLPDASSEWWAYADATGIGEYNDWCYEGLADCGTEALVRGLWLDAVAQGGDIQEAAVALTNALAYSVEESSIAGSRWLGPDGDRRTCLESLSSESASTVLGREAEVYALDPGKSIGYAAEALAGVTSCGINERSDALGTVSILPGGAWAWESILDQLAEEPVTITGVEAATIRCNSIAEGCVVDLALDGDWIRVGALPEAGDARTAAVALAEAIASR